MRFVSLFSKYMNSIYRVIIGVCFFLVALFCGFTLINNGFNFLDYRVLINIFSLLLFIVVFIFPQKIELLSIVSFIYSVQLLITVSFNKNQFCLLLYVLSCAILFSRGYFRKGRWPKVIAAIVVYIGLFCSQIRWGVKDFVVSIFIFAIYAMALFLIIFFYYLYLRNQGKSPIEKIIDLSMYPELTDRDKEWLELILKETKYTEIASKYNISLGTVKNRFRFIFDVLDVSDRIGFMATYGGYELKF